MSADTLESQVTRQVTEQIEAHRAAMAAQSYLARAASTVYNPAAVTLRELVLVGEELERDHGRGYISNDAQRADSIRQKIEADRQALGHSLQVSTTVSGLLSSAPLFVPGKIGWLASAALGALNGASPRDSRQNQTADAFLGAAKGLAFKGVFTASAGLPGGFLTRTAFMASGQRALDVSLNRSTYLDSATGGIDLSGGLSRTARVAFNPYSLGADAGSQALSAAAAVGLNYLTAGSIGRNPLVLTMVLGAMSGFNCSISGDLRNYFELGVPISPTGSLVSGSGHALLGALAALPGGVVRQHQDLVRRAELLEQTKSPPLPGTLQRIMVDGREALLRLPAGRGSRDAKLPLVVLLHGTAGSAGEMAAKTRLFQKADAHGLMLLFPEGNDVLADRSLRVWHIPVPGLSNRGGIAADARSVAALIADVQKRYGGDPGRTEVWGMSAGGTVARSIATNYPERVAALGLVAAPHVGADIPTGVQTTVISGDYLSSGRGLLTALGLRPQGDLIQSLQQANGIELKKVHHAGRVTVQQFTDNKGLKITDVHVDGARHSWNGNHANAAGDQPGPVSRLLLSRLLRRSRAPAAT